MITTVLWDTFMSKKLRWILFLSVMFMNFIAYYQDPTRYTTEPQCLLGTPCKWFDYVAGMATFTFDTITFISLWYTIGSPTLQKWLPEYWFLPFIIIGYAVITQITIDSPTITNNDELLAAPPKYMWQHSWRITLYTIILLCDVIIFTQLYIDSGYNNYSQNLRVFDYVIGGRFGGWGGGNKVQFIFAWLGFCGVMMDLIALYFVYTYSACQYNLPKSWDY